MKNYDHATVANERHTHTVRTWQNPDGSYWFKITVDGVLIDEGTLDDPVEAGT